MTRRHHPPIAFTIIANAASKSNRRRIVSTPQGKLRSIKSREALAFVRDCKLQCPKRADLPFTVPVVMTLRMFYPDERSDMDESALLDALQSAYTGTGKARRMCWLGLYVNDRLVRERHVYHDVDAKESARGSGSSRARMRYKVSELRGRMLDAAVGKSLGLGVRLQKTTALLEQWHVTDGEGYWGRPHYYSTDWGTSGKMIEMHGLCLRRVNGIRWEAWIAGEKESFAPSALVACMRAYVSHVQGAEIELP